MENSYVGDSMMNNLEKIKEKLVELEPNHFLKFTIEAMIDQIEHNRKMTKCLIKALVEIRENKAYVDLEKEVERQIKTYQAEEQRDREIRGMDRQIAMDIGLEETCPDKSFEHVIDWSKTNDLVAHQISEALKKVREKENIIYRIKPSRVASWQWSGCLYDETKKLMRAEGLELDLRDIEVLKLFGENIDKVEGMIFNDLDIWIEVYMKKRKEHDAKS